MTLRARVVVPALLAAAGIASLVAVAVRGAPPASAQVGKLKVPPGFRVGVFSESVPGARSLALGPKGTVFVGTRAEGRVYALRDADGDGVAEGLWTVAEGLDQPNGVALRDGALYVAEVSRVLRFERAEETLGVPQRPVVVHEGLPRDRAHGWKFIAFGPDGRLYVPVGAPGNAVLREDDPRYASILRESEDRRSLEVFASGVRNTVGFDWDPRTKELWFTDNGRDGLGDDVPPDELDRAPRAGLHFGYPFLHGRSVRDPDLWAKRTREDFTLPEIELGAHVAALGMRFYGGAMFPAEYRGQVFVAEHGSWDRSTPAGYRVSLVRMKDGRAVSYEPFATGWLDLAAWGRPVDVLVAHDGALLVSDDRAGAVYRIVYAPPPR